MKLKHSQIIAFALLGAGCMLFSCKDKIEIGQSPYANGPAPLVQFKNVRPVPEDGKVGTEVTYAVTGLNTDKEFTFYINQTKAKVVAATDSTVTVKVPEDASSGAASVEINGQAYYGPIFKVDGKVALATSFDPTQGANYGIRQIYKVPNNDYYLIVGNFTDYQGIAAASAGSDDDRKYVNHIAAISATGEFQTGRLSAGKGANGTINSVVKNTTTGDLFIGGVIGTYNVRSGIYNVTRLNSDASLDTMEVDLINLDPENTPNAGKDTVPSFNGGVAGSGLFSSVVKLFFDQPSNELFVVGNFNYYLNTYYPRSTKGGLIVHLTPINQLLKMTADGDIDSTFNFDPTTHKTLTGGNGYISDAVRMPDGKIILVGLFTKYNDQMVNHICRIDDATGRIDPSFQTGSGADGSIGRITYNKVTNKILITGAFHHFNGVPANGVVMLNADGSVDQNFNFGKTTMGRASYAGQLDNGLIIVSGRFLKYEGVIRSGFMILNPDGTLAKGYNNTGAFVGQIQDIAESKTTLNEPGVILVGSFSIFDNEEVHNIVKIALKN